VAAKKRVVAKVGKRSSSPAGAAKTKAQAKVAKASPAASTTKNRAKAVVKKAAAPARATQNAGQGKTPRGSGAAAKTHSKASAKGEASLAGGLAAGARAPEFELVDQRGESVSSAGLAGQPYVLYFYPKNDTPGCTTQACGFRDAHPDFERLGVRVIGVSPDSVVSHQKFIAKYGLPFTLLSDGAQSLASKYGVWSLKKNYGREYMGIVRSTFLVDGEGVIRKVWRGVRVNGHIAEVQGAAADLARASA
jgi:thioredoxin-dependent peroxiredoxin